MGGGNDTFTWDPGDGSDIVEGQSDDDTLLFNGAAGGELFTASSNGVRLSFTRDLGNIVMDTDDVERILTVNALGGIEHGDRERPRTSTDVDQSQRRPRGHAGRRDGRRPGRPASSSNGTNGGDGIHVNAGRLRCRRGRADGPRWRFGTRRRPTRSRSTVWTATTTSSAAGLPAQAIALTLAGRRWRRRDLRRPGRRQADRRRRQRHARRQQGQRPCSDGRRRRHVRLGSGRRQRHRRRRGRRRLDALHRRQHRRADRRVGEREPRAVRPRRRQRDDGHRRPRADRLPGPRRGRPGQRRRPDGNRPREPAASTSRALPAPATARPTASSSTAPTATTRSTSAGTQTA